MERAKNISKHKNFIFLLVVLFGNLWIYELLRQNLIVFLVTAATTIFFFKNFDLKSKYSFFAIIAILILQYATTDIANLQEISSEKSRIQSMRLMYYPKIELNLIGKKITPPIGYWTEVKSETTAFRQIEKNVFENLSLNYFFFANHPRERHGIIEKEKFPYSLIIPFVIGLFVLLKKNLKSLFFTLGMPLIILGIIGNSNPMGPFSLFPFIAISSSMGLEEFFVWSKRFDKWKLPILFLIVHALIIFQTISYEY